MAKDNSFDVVSEVDFQEIDNAVNQANKEISTRYDFKGSKSIIKWDKNKRRSSSMQTTTSSSTASKIFSTPK